MLILKSHKFDPIYKIFLVVEVLKIFKRNIYLEKARAVFTRIMKEQKVLF